jgi:hypothetical protein
MQKRLRTLHHILAVQKDLQRLAELRLALLQRKETELQKDQERLVTYLDEDHSYTGNYAKMIATRLQSLAVQKQRTVVEKQQQAERAIEYLRRVGQAQRSVDAATEILRRIEERKELDATIEAELNRKQASLR